MTKAMIMAKAMAKAKAYLVVGKWLSVIRLNGEMVGLTFDIRPKTE